MEALSQEDNFEAMGALVAERFLELTVEEALGALLENEVPSGPILSAEDAISDVQAVHNQTVRTWQHPDAGTIQGAHPAARFSKTEIEMAQWFSARGGDNAEVLGELGKTPDEIAALVADGVIGA